MTDGVFRVYVNIEDGLSVVQAVDVTEDNIVGVRNIVRGKITEGDRLSFPSIVAPTTDEVAEVGDYVVTDLAGGFTAVDKELFESQYRPL